MLILVQKLSKIALFEKMRILGRRSFESHFITQKFQDQKIDLKFFILGQKVSKIAIFQSKNFIICAAVTVSGEEELPNTWDENT